MSAPPPLSRRAERVAEWFDGRHPTVTLRDSEIMEALGYQHTAVLLALGELEELGAITRTRRATKSNDTREVRLNYDNPVWQWVRLTKQLRGQTSPKPARTRKRVTK